MRQSSRFARRIANEWCQRGSWRHLSAEERVSQMASVSLGSMVPRKDYFGRSDGWKASVVRVPFETVPFEHSFASSTSPLEQKDDVQTGLTLPSMQDLRKLNPDIAEIVDMHEATQRYVLKMIHISEYPTHCCIVTCRSLEDKGILKRVMDELETHKVSKSGNVTKTALMKLKVNVLRGILEGADADPRGNKAALVERILDEIRKDTENVQVESVAPHLGTGVASRKAIVKFSRLKDIQHGKSKTPVMQTHSTVPIHEPAQFSRVFSGPDEVAKLLVDANGNDVAIIDVRGTCSFTDYMVVASGQSYQMVHMLAQSVFHELKTRTMEVAPGVSPSIEGSDDSNPEWLVVDAGSIVVHVFHEDHRTEYDLEGLWGGEDSSNVIRVAMPRHRLTRDTIQ